MSSSKPLESRSGAQTLERGLNLIERIVEAPMTVQALAESSGLGLNTTRRLAGSLVNCGYLVMDANRVYKAGPKLFELALRGRGHVGLVDVARRHLRTLSQTTGAPSFLGERDGDHSVHLHRAAGTQRVMVSTPVGTRRNLPETSLGKALLLDDSEDEWERLFGKASPEFLAKGWREAMRLARGTNLVVHEIPSADRLRAVAAPVRDASGAIVAAISVVSVMQYAGDADVEKIVPLVREAAAEISRELGHHNPR